jgi:hypothetical protein
LVHKGLQAVPLYSPPSTIIDPAGTPEPVGRIAEAKYSGP